LNAASGLVEVASGKEALADVVWRDSSTGMAFLPAILAAPRTDPLSLLSSASTKRLFDELQKQYDFVVVDLSPLGVVDVCATTEFVDAYVLVIEWGRTTVDTVQHALRATPVVAQSIIGAVLNKADLKALATYDPYRTSYYFGQGEQ